MDMEIELDDVQPPTQQDLPQEHPLVHVQKEEKDMSEAYLRLEREGGAQVQELTSQLKAVLEADQAQELKGGFRSGKRLDIKKVISYIASNYRKDKIWLRRSEPEKRNF